MQTNYNTKSRIPDVDKSRATGADFWSRSASPPGVWPGVAFPKFGTHAALDATTAPQRLKPFFFRHLSGTVKTVP